MSNKAITQSFPRPLVSNAACQLRISLQKLASTWSPFSRIHCSTASLKKTSAVAPLSGSIIGVSTILGLRLLPLFFEFFATSRLHLKYPLDDNQNNTHGSYCWRTNDVDQCSCTKVYHPPILPEKTKAFQECTCPRHHPYYPLQLVYHVVSHFPWTTLRGHPAIWEQHAQHWGLA